MNLCGSFVAGLSPSGHQ